MTKIKAILYLFVLTGCSTRNLVSSPVAEAFDPATGQLKGGGRSPAGESHRGTGQSSSSSFEDSAPARYMWDLTKHQCEKGGHPENVLGWAYISPGVGTLLSRQTEELVDNPAYPYQGSLDISASFKTVEPEKKMVQTTRLNASALFACVKRSKNTRGETVLEITGGDVVAVNLDRQSLLFKARLGEEGSFEGPFRLFEQGFLTREMLFEKGYISEISVFSTGDERVRTGHQIISKEDHLSLEGYGMLPSTLFRFPK